jgi:SAM-dependent methyltransferase
MQFRWESRLTQEPIGRIENALIFRADVERPAPEGFARRIISTVVDKVYLGHNRTRAVKRTLGALVSAAQGPDAIGLNFGSGQSARLQNIVNLDICYSSNVDIVYDGYIIPFRDETFDMVMSQEVFEHIPDPYNSLREVARVMKFGAKFYLQLPFIIGFHGIPHDYWRFTKSGIREFATTGGLFEIVDEGMAVGHGTGLYRVLVEFFATTASVFGRIFYKPVKMVAAILFYWVKFFDLLTPYATEPHRVAGGYFVVLKRSDRR